MTPDPGAPDHDPLRTLADLLGDEGGLLAAATVAPDVAADRSLGAALATTPRARIVGPALLLAVEATREAELLHHAPEQARVVRTDDRDLALLVGDRLYALGIEGLAAGGWTGEVATLADVVALVAVAHAAPAWASVGATSGKAGDEHPDDVAPVAERTRELWARAVRALGAGRDSAAARALRGVLEESESR